MIFGATGMSLSMVILAITDSIGTEKAGIATTVFLFVFNTFFASEFPFQLLGNDTDRTLVGWLGMTWLYPAEIVPLKIRAPANAVSTTGT